MPITAESDQPPPARRCRKDVWETNMRGAYHTHVRQEDPKIWEAGNGRWRVVQTSPGRQHYRLERLDGGVWGRFGAGANSDDLFALAARTDAKDGITTVEASTTCWMNL
jgi:hypothetical protein